MTDQPTPAETIKSAAAMLREAAEAASKGPWKFPHRSHPGVVTGPHGCLWYPANGRNPAGRINHEPDAAYIALVDPAVGLAVADWLDAEAQVAEPSDGWIAVQALAVARALFGGSRV